MPKIKDKMISLRRIRAFELVDAGLTFEKVGQVLGVNERTVRRWRKEVDEVLLISKEWAIARAQIRSMLLKATKVYNKYLDGKGDAVGGDERCATKILENAFLLKPGQAAEKIEANISAYSVDIKITAQENDKFADAVIPHIGQLAQLLAAAGNKKTVST